MATEPKSKKSSTTVEATQSDDAQPNPDGFLTELDNWGTKPNPASFEKLLETNQQKFARALEQGYSADDICRLAASYGIQVKPSTFRKYWHKLDFLHKLVEDTPSQYFRLYRPSYAELVSRCQQIKQRS